MADYRAPTPTAAAERAVPVRSELINGVRTFGIRMGGTMRRALEHWRSRVTASSRGLPRRDAILGLPRQRLDTASGRLLQSLRANTQSHRAVLAREAAALRPNLVARRLANARDLLTRLDRDRARGLGARVERARHLGRGVGRRVGTGCIGSVHASLSCCRRRTHAINTSRVRRSSVLTPCSPRPSRSASCTRDAPSR